MVLSVKHKIHEILGKNIRENLWNPGLGRKFLYLVPKAQSRKGKIDKSNYFKIKTFCPGGGKKN